MTFRTFSLFLFPAVLLLACQAHSGIYGEDPGVGREYRFEKGSKVYYRYSMCTGSYSGSGHYSIRHDSIVFAFDSLDGYPSSCKIKGPLRNDTAIIVRLRVVDAENFGFLLNCPVEVYADDGRLLRRLLCDKSGYTGMVAPRQDSVSIRIAYLNFIPFTFGLKGTGEYNVLVELERSRVQTNRLIKFTRDSLVLWRPEYPMYPSRYARFPKEVERYRRKEQ